MNRIIFIIILQLISSMVFAQKFSQEFGKISLDELELKNCPGDKDAEAFIIYDIGNSYFIYDYDKGYEVVFVRKVKIKIVKKSGLNWGDFEIPLYQENRDYEDLLEVEATTYNMENRRINKTQLDPKNIYKEEHGNNWISKKFAMPDLKEGSVIEVSYKIQSPYLFNLQDWSFQHTIPTLYSEYTVKITPFFNYVYILMGTNKFDIFETTQERSTSSGPYSAGPYSSGYDDAVYKFGFKNLPAFKDESFITSKNDYMVKIDFQLSDIHRPDGSKIEYMTTWPKLIKDVLKHEEFGRYLNQAEKSGKSNPEIQSFNSQPQLNRFESIVSYVKKNYNWDGYRSFLAKKTVKEFQKDKLGNSANLNLYLAGLLKSAGIDAYPVILSTRDHGKVSTGYPFIHYFNYVIVLAKIDNKIVLGDATDPLCPISLIPPQSINEKGLVIDKEKENWLLLSNNSLSTIDEKIALVLHENTDTLSCQIKINTTGYDAYDFRKDFQNDIEKIESHFKQNNYTDIDSIQTKNYDNINEFYSISFNSKYEIEKADNKTYISPFLSEVMKINPMKQQNRQYPVDMVYPKRRVYTTTIIIPDNYKIELLPEKQTIDNELFKMDYLAMKLNDTTILVRATYTTTQAVYSPEEYSKIRYYYNEMITKLNEKVVLIKNE